VNVVLFFFFISRRLILLGIHFFALEEKDASNE